MSLRFMAQNLTYGDTFLDRILKGFRFFQTIPQNRSPISKPMVVCFLIKSKEHVALQFTNKRLPFIMPHLTPLVTGLSRTVFFCRKGCQICKIINLQMSSHLHYLRVSSLFLNSRLSISIKMTL